MARDTSAKWLKESHISETMVRFRGPLQTSAGARAARQGTTLPSLPPVDPLMIIPSRAFLGPSKRMIKKSGLEDVARDAGDLCAASVTYSQTSRLRRRNPTAVARGPRRLRLKTSNFFRKFKLPHQYDRPHIIPALKRFGFTCIVEFSP